MPFCNSVFSNYSNIRSFFFDRTGGVSSDLYSSLNCSYSVGDDSASVTKNRTIVANYFNVSENHLLTMNQVHGKNVVVVDSLWKHDNAPEADAIVTDRPGIVLGVLTADCAPILLFDKEKRIIGAVHAGWRGALGGVIEATIEAMCSMGSSASDIRAAIGPCIGLSSFHVPEDFLDQFLKQTKKNSVFFHKSDSCCHRDGCIHFDFLSYVKFRLEESRIKSVQSINIDTFTNENYFSYRKACKFGDGVCGRQISAIMLQEC